MDFECLYMLSMLPTIRYYDMSDEGSQVYQFIILLHSPHQMRQIINTIFCVSSISRCLFCSASLRSIGTGWILMRISFDVKLSLTAKTSLFSMNFINLQSNKSQNCTDFLTISLSEQYLLGWSAHRK